MKVSKKILMIGSFITLLAGCSANEVETGAQRVVVSHAPAAKECKFLGQVSGNQGNFFTGGWTSNKNLEVGAMNTLRNEAHRMGANYVSLVTNRAGQHGSGGGSSDMFGGSSQQVTVVNIGNAYHCPPHLIGL
jgi:hypothetical protein